MSSKPEKSFEDTTRKEEIWNSISHGIGIPLGLAGLALLLVQGFHLGNWVYLVAVTVYGLSLTWTYITSTLYHSLHNASVKKRNFLHLLDHTAIYIFIAGTYTPVALFALPDIWDISILIGIWALAIAGVLIKVFSIGKYKKLSLVFYLLMGWMIIVAIEPLISFAPMPLLYWMLAGGIFYSLGTIFFSLRKLRFSHAIWHLFVLAGSACHFVGIYAYLQVG